MNRFGTLNLARPAVKARDDKHYYSLITIQVEDCLFRVPPSAFKEQSQVFRDMFSFPKIPANGGEGSSDNNPIYLAGVNLDAFRDFLELLYPSSHCKETISTFHARRPADRWIGVLDLAGMWDFKPIQDLAISELERCVPEIDVIRKIEIAHKHSIKHWYFPAYKALAKRENPLETTEAVRLGYDFAMKMAQVRERRLERSMRNLRCNSCGGTKMQVSSPPPFTSRPTTLNFSTIKPHPGGANPEEGDGELDKDIEKTFGAEVVQNIDLQNLNTPAPSFKWY